MGKEYVPIFFDWMEETADLTAEETGILIDALVSYFSRGEQNRVNEESSEMLRIVYTEMVERVERYYASDKRSGEYHWNWKGGLTPVNQRERSSRKYAEWRKAVFTRDNFTCQRCGKVGGGLQAHHIKPWATNVDERYRVRNGVTLCEKCHRELHRK